MPRRPRATSLLHANGSAGPGQRSTPSLRTAFGTSMSRDSRRQASAERDLGETRPSYVREAHVRTAAPAPWRTASTPPWVVLRGYAILLIGGEADEHA